LALAVAPEPRVSDIERLIEQVRRYDPDVDADLLRRAYVRAEQAHAGQLRDSGAPYIEHPLQVAHLLAELGSDAPTIAAGILHDVVEDTTLELETIDAEFGDEVAHLVDGVTKLSQAELSQNALAEAGMPDEDAPSEVKLRERAANIRKIFLAMAKDVRVMIIKLADRLHNVQTLEGLAPERQKRVAEETLQIFAPLAHRLGIWHLKWQLEDLSFKYLHPEEYEKLVEALARTRRDREEDVAEVRRILGEELEKHGIRAEIQGRAKHLYSIWNKTRKQQLALDELYDLIAVRVIVDTKEECYHVLGIVHEVWLPLPGLFSDHIARPKPNMYQSLHTKVLGPRGEPIEIQIRTWEMHRTADFGVAAHWNYKEGGKEGGREGGKEGGRPDRRFENKLTWLRQQLFDWQSDSSTDTEFMRCVVEDLFTDQVFVFTPRGDVIDLPVGSGPIDFAFRIHSELGLRCTGARVNGKLVPLTYRFKNGDIVEIMTRPSAQPSYDWLNMVKTSHAKSRIRAWFRKQRHSENVARGRELLEKEAGRLGHDPRELFKGDRLAEAAAAMNYHHEEDMLAGIGHGYVAAGTVVNKLKAQEPPKPQVIVGRRAEPGKLRISADGMEDLFISRARCCSPLPGEEVIGYITRGKGIAIHREGCANLQGALANEPDRIQRVDWTPDAEARHSVPLRIEKMDRQGLMADVMAVFSGYKINIEQANVRTRPKESALWDLVVDVRDAAELEQVIRSVRAIPDVLGVSRPGPEERKNGGRRLPARVR
jgi:GTP diphosphokinase / guanosine-3',5'-bis(diphosphate) 3'-diphosphatase